MTLLCQLRVPSVVFERQTDHTIEGRCLGHIILCRQIQWYYCLV